MRYGIRLTPEAEQDLRDIWRGLTEFTESKNPDQLIQAIKQKFKLLGQFPHSGRSRNVLLPGLRSIPVKRWIIYYRVGETRIEIVRVVDCRRDLTQFFNLEEPEEESD
jgi:toxin ParE1/3/4